MRGDPAISVPMRLITARKTLPMPFGPALLGVASTSFSTSWAVRILAKQWRTAGDHRFPRRSNGGKEKIDLLALAAKRVIVTGSMLRPRAARRKGRHRRCSLQKALADSISGSLPPIIDKVFPLLSAADAHRRIEAGDHIGKIVLKVGLA